MKLPIRRRLHAQEQIEAIVLRIASENLDAALRFVDAVEYGLTLLVENPEIGPRYETDAPDLVGLRKWLVPSFPRYLIFYLVDDRAIHIIDIVDARSDYRVKNK